MSNLYRGPSKDASYQVSIHLAKRLNQEEKIFQKSTNQKHQLPMAAMFVNGSGQNQQSLERTFHRCFLPSFTSFQWRIQRGAEGTFAPSKKERKRKIERGVGGSSVPLLSISAFILSPVKCNKSLYIFTRCIALLVYLITFELLRQSTINQNIILKSFLTDVHKL